MLNEQDIKPAELKEDEKPYNIRHRRYYFSKNILLFVKDCKFAKVYNSLFDQLIRSATSIGANLVEGKAGSSKKDWEKYLVIALKSANETKYWLCLIRDTLETDERETSKLLNEVEEISNIMASIIINSYKKE